MRSKREQIILSAMALFDEHGFHATGIDRIVAAADVSKKTLYHHFRTKDELILAVLQYKDSIVRNAMMKAVDDRYSTAHEKLLGIYELAGEWFQDEKFFGCLYMSAAGEFPDSGSAIRHACREHKLQLKAWFRKLCENAGLAHAERLSDSLFLLYEGATVTAQVTGDTHAAARASETARLLLQNAS